MICGRMLHCAKLMHDGKPFCYLKTLAPCIALSCSFQLYSLVRRRLLDILLFFALSLKGAETDGTTDQRTPPRGAFLPSRHDDDH